MKVFFIDDFSPYLELFPELSKTQLKIFVMYGHGITPERITLELNITLNTFYSHIKYIKDKYQVDSSSELRGIFYARRDLHYMRSLKKLTRKI